VLPLKQKPSKTAHRDRKALLHIYHPIKGKIKRPVTILREGRQTRENSSEKKAHKYDAKKDHRVAKKESDPRKEGGSRGRGCWSHGCSKHKRERIRDRLFKGKVLKGGEGPKTRNS